MAEIKKRTLVGRATDFFKDQLEDLDIIAAHTGISRAQLLRSGADYVIAQHKAILDKHKKNG